MAAWFASRFKESRALWTEARTIGQWLAVCYVVDRYVFHLSMTHGPSMLPTLNEMGDVVVVDKLTPRFSWLSPIARGDIVVADSSYRKDFSVCKRVIGLAGDVVHTPGQGGRSVTVPPGHVWLEGDNPRNSVDSRTYGPVPQALIRGRVAARVWPLSASRWLGAPGTVPPRPTSNTVFLTALLADEGVVGDVGDKLRSAREQAVAAAHKAMLDALWADMKAGWVPSVVTCGGDVDNAARTKSVTTRASNETSDTPMA